MFTLKSSMHDSFKNPAFKGKEYMLRVSTGIPSAVFSRFSMARLGKMFGCDAQALANGLEYLDQALSKRKVFYDIWSEEDKKADPSKCDTGIAYFPAEKKGKYIVLCAGGAYQVVMSVLEAYPFAERLNKMGYTVFVLRYRDGKYAIMPNQIEDLAQAIKYITAHAEEFNVETDNYAVCGCSAGAHMTAAIGTEDLGYLHYGIKRPGALFLAYPFISYDGGEKLDVGIRKTCFGKEHANDRDLIEKYSVEYHVTESYPPAYVWQSEEDGTCPFRNSQVITAAMKAKGVPYEYITYPGTAHGWGVGDGTPAEGWLTKACDFWEKHI